MHKLDQPGVKTSTAATAGDAAVQISAEELHKSILIGRGLKADVERQYPGLDHTSSTHYQYGQLLAITEFLTSSNKHSREWAKAEVRRLVKLGKGE